MDKSDDLRVIREMMEKSSRFLSLSGLSGVAAGITALIGTFAAWLMLTGRIGLPEVPGSSITPLVAGLGILAIAVMMVAVGLALYFTMRKAKKNSTPFWTPVTMRMVVNLMIPLATGGLFVVILLYYGEVYLIPSLLLIFYGLALVNAGKFTFEEITFLGLFEVVTGLVAALFPGYGLWFWGFGFGILHILYGALMHIRYR